MQRNPHRRGAVRHRPPAPRRRSATRTKRGTPGTIPKSLKFQLIASALILVFAIGIANMKNAVTAPVMKSFQKGLTQSMDLEDLNRMLRDFAKSVPVFSGFFEEEEGVPVFEPTDGTGGTGTDSEPGNTDNPDPAEEGADPPPGEPETSYDDDGEILDVYEDEQGELAPTSAIGGGDLQTLSLIEDFGTEDLAEIAGSYYTGYLTYYTGLLEQAHDEIEHNRLLAQMAEMELPDNAIDEKIDLGVKLKMPLSGTMTCDFGYRIHPITGKIGFHSGVDLGAATGTTIKSAAAGTVIEVGTSAVYGKYVIVEHSNKLKTFYAHMSKTSVKQGKKVKAGTKLGEVGSTGVSTGPHLHFEIRYDGKVVNPRKILGF
ncbi:M23 family metallopeptidase [Feifania hominis]|uniref:M23 family metallopeptidase n=1 Tax=Feifania hominis TaxID=2763660 RepID=A0A926HTJ7_9FIRM|nr:M23 family metallopeptidase [Feifania hominis]MBC8535939.1 M23 family metallopeptidase [Feifania hominis]